MVDIDNINDDESRRSEDDATDEAEAARITRILDNMDRRAECGSVIKIAAKEILQPEQYEHMICPYIYGIISNIEDVCPITGSNAYQINWNFEHLSIGNTFLEFVALYFEHDFVVVKFPDEADDHDDSEFTRQFKKDKENGEWTIIDYAGLMCEFCEHYTCDRVQYSNELQSMCEEVGVMGIPSNEKRYLMYRRFIDMKHGSLGKRVRKKLDECVQELIVGAFPVEAGKRKRGFRAISDHA